MWIIPVFSLCTGCDSRSPRLRPLSWLRPGSGIPSISTAYAQARCRCAQVIHMFVHRQQEGSPVAWLAGSSRSARRCSRARPAGRMRGSGPGRDEIAPGRQLPDDRRQEERQPAHLTPRNVRGKLPRDPRPLGFLTDHEEWSTAVPGRGSEEGWRSGGDRRSGSTSGTRARTSSWNRRASGLRRPRCLPR